MQVVKWIVEFLLSDSGQTLLLWMVGSVFGAIQTSKWYQGIKDKRMQDLVFKSYKMLEVAVNNRFDKVRQMKASRPNGKLTAEDMVELEKEVLTDLDNMKNEIGVDAVKIIGSNFVGPAIVHTVRRLKGAVIGKDQTALPSDTSDMFPQS